MKQLLVSLLLVTAGSTPVAFATEVAYPSLDVLAVVRRAVELQVSVNAAMGSLELPSTACFYLGRSAAELQNLQQASGRIGDLGVGVILSGIPLPDWLADLSKELDAVRELSKALLNATAPCVSRGTASPPESSVLETVQEELRALLLALDPYVKRAINELGPSELK